MNDDPTEFYEAMGNIAFMLGILFVLWIVF